MRILKPLTCLLGLLAVTGLLHAESLDFELWRGTTLQLDNPEAWSIQPSEREDALQLELNPEGDRDAVLHLTIFEATPDSAAATSEGLRTLLEVQGYRQLHTALQSEIRLEEISAIGGSGYLYRLTDRHEERGPGDYREAHQGGLLLNGYVVSFTILTHSDDRKSLGEALEIVRSLDVAR